MKQYCFTKFQWMRYLVQGSLILILFCYVFYKSLWPVLPGIPFLYFYIQKTKQRLSQREESRMLQQFKDSITVLSGMLLSGYAVESAMEKTAGEMEVMWGKDSRIVGEYRIMLFQMGINKTAEEVWQEFGRRSGLEEIEEFADIFSVVKRSGGELAKVIQLAVNQIQETSMTEEQIRVQTASRRYEQKIMNGMPILILLYVGMSSPDIMAPMYETWMGRIIMTVCLAVYIGACILAERIGTIRL